MVIDTVNINDSIVIKDKLAINNAVPNAVINSMDSFLQIHQDTVFFQDKNSVELFLICMLMEILP